MPSHESLSLGLEQTER